MNRKEYKEYQEAVKDFFDTEGIVNLSQQPINVEEVEETGVDWEYGEPYFSWHACHCCGSSLGGDRYTCNGYNPTTKEIQEDYAICPDCYYYAEYGQLNDMIMMEIEDSEKELDHYKANPFSGYGGYQVNAIMADGEIMCHECICNEEEVFQDNEASCSDGHDPAWRFIHADVYWEGPTLYCSHCNKPLESEYGDPDVVE